MNKLLFAFLLSASSFALASDLCDEIQQDPLGRGYSGMDAAAIVADLNTAYRQQWRDCVPGEEAIEAIDPSDWVALGDTARDRTLTLFSIGCLNPQGNAKSILIQIYGSGSQTIANLADIGRVSITRADELGLGAVKVGHVEACQQ